MDFAASSMFHKRNLNRNAAFRLVGPQIIFLFFLSRLPRQCVNVVRPPQEAIQLDGEILYALLRRVSPVAHRHLKQHKLEPILYMTEWFMCAFSRTLPWASVLRVWDMFLCEGATYRP